jgi:N-acetylglucosamine malate deacetylase 1
MPSVLAIAAHPDDIEFIMAGTMLQLKKKGWDLHYLNIANGCCGSQETDRDETARIRLEEARQGAMTIGATFYEPFCDDMGIFYTPENLAKTAAIVRQANPQIVLTHARHDYMEDHEAACRLAVSAAFIKFTPNFRCDPATLPALGDVAIYHAQPHGNCTQMLDPVIPTYVVDCSDVIDVKRQSLEHHKSQQNWLDSTQKMNSYVQSMIDNSARVGSMFKTGFAFGEGWRRHLHYGFCAADFDPLKDALGDLIKRVES